MIITRRFNRGASMRYNSILLRLSNTKGSNHSNIFTKHPHQQQQQQQQQWTKLFPPSRSCSSTTSVSSSSTTQVGLLGWYLSQLKLRPIITKSITSSFIFAASDFTSQMITSSPTASYDLMRTSRMAAYGFFILGFTQHKWFTLIAKNFPERDVWTTIKKLVMGMCIYGPCMTSVFFSFNAVLKGENGEEIGARLKRDLLPTLTNGIFYWPICDFVIYKFVPVQLQPLANNSCAYVWTIYLSYMANLKGARSDSSFVDQIRSLLRLINFVRLNYHQQAVDKRFSTGKLHACIMDDIFDIGKVLGAIFQTSFDDHKVVGRHIRAVGSLQTRL
ncbi:hypothetical protein ACFE04_007830 [Oxalis oulophora]